MTNKALGRIGLLFLALLTTGIFLNNDAYLFPGLIGLILLAMLVQGKAFEVGTGTPPDPEPFKIGQKVVVFDRYRISVGTPAYGRIITFSQSNSGIEVEMIPGKNSATRRHPTVWLCPEQIRPFGYISVDERRFKS